MKNDTLCNERWSSKLCNTTICTKYTFVWLRRLKDMESKYTYPYCTSKFWIAYNVAGTAAARRLSPSVHVLQIFVRSSFDALNTDSAAITILVISVTITIEDFETPEAVKRVAIMGCKPNCNASREQNMRDFWPFSDMELVNDFVFAVVSNPTLIATVITIWS